MNQFLLISFLFHGLALTLLFLFPTPQKEEKKEPLIVRRVNLKKEVVQKEAPKKKIEEPIALQEEVIPPPEIVSIPIPEIAVAEPEPEPPPPPQKPSPKKEIKKKPCPPPKKKAEKKPSSKVEKPKVETKKVEPPPPPKQNPKREALLQQARESLSKAKNSPKTGEAASKEVAYSTPKKLASLESEKMPIKEERGTPGETSYREELRRRLQLKLSLPESGFVEIKLTLDRKGTCKNVEVMKGSSPKNRKAVLDLVPTLIFPPFGSHFSGEATHTFLITLTSD